MSNRRTMTKRSDETKESVCREYLACKPRTGERARLLRKEGIPNSLVHVWLAKGFGQKGTEKSAPSHTPVNVPWAVNHDSVLTGRFKKLQERLNDLELENVVLRANLTMALRKGYLSFLSMETR